MITFFLLTNIITIFIGLYKTNIVKKSIHLDHNTFFSLGFFFYFLVPVIVGNYNLFNDYEIYKQWFDIYNKVSDFTVIMYLIFINIFYIVFIYYSNKSIIEIEQKKDNQFISEKTFFFPFLCLLILSTLFVIKYSHNFFTGYNAETLDMTYKGQFTALTVVYFSILMLYHTNKVKNVEYSFIKILIHPYTVLYYILAVLNLSMGGRLYFVSQIFCLSIFYCKFYKDLKIKTILILVATIILSMTMIGVTRIHGNINIINIILNFISEPIFTSYTLITSLRYGEITFFQFPIVLLSYFINIIPTMILPNKLDYVLQAQQFGFTIYNPGGAYHLFTSLMVNFGIIGSILFFFGLGRIIYNLKERNYTLTSTIYILFAGYITFTFFRDGFETSLIKNIFEFSILIPAIVYYGCLFIEKHKKKKG